MDCTVHGVAKSRTQLSDFHFTSPQHRTVRHCDRGHDGGGIGNRGGRDVLTETQGMKKGSNRQGVGGTASQVEGIALGSRVKTAGLQFHSVSHINIQFACKSVCSEPTHFWAISTAPPQLSPGISHLGQCGPSSQVCRLAPSDPTICSPASARGG